MAASESLIDIDPVAYLRDIERTWRARDGRAAAAGYTDDAVLIYGNAQTRSGEALRQWPQQWFDYAEDLDIRKTFRAFSGDCLAGEWESRYTHPQTGKPIRERGAEFFFLRGDKVYLHHMYEHTWPEGENTDDAWPTI